MRQEGPSLQLWGELPPANGRSKLLTDTFSSAITSSMKTFEYRLFTNKQQHALLMHCLRESRLIYNEMLEVTKQHYEEQGTFPTKYDLTALFQGHGSEHVPATTVQMLADRLSKSLNRFLARKALAVKVGFPRFTSQKCHQCGEIVQKALSVRTHLCPFCGYVADRDVNAAKNILMAGAPPSGAKHSVGSVRLRSPQL